jgi:hypothetical protein
MRRPKVQVEPLEGRTLLTAVLIDATNNLSITGTAASNSLTISVASGTYTFEETADTFTVTNLGSATVNGNGTNTLTVSGIIAIEVTTGDGDDAVNLQSNDVDTTINTGQGAGDVVNLGSLAPATGGNLFGLLGGATIDDDDSSQVNVDDSGDATGRTVLIGELATRTIVTVLGLSLPDLLVGENVGSVQLNSGTGDDTFNVGGLAGTTKLSINGGGGDDALAFTVSPLLNFGVFNGGTGTNLIDYSSAPVAGLLGVTVNLTTGTASFTDGIANVQNVTGSDGDDTIIGDNQTNILHGGPGDDTINSEGGAGAPGDSIFGDDGDDTIAWDPGDGTDFTDGGAGNNIQIVNRGNGNNNMLVRTDNSDPTHTFFDGTGFTIDLVRVQQLNVEGQGGIDTLTVDFINGSPFTNLTGIAGGPGINYDGGTEAGRLILQRSGGTYTANNENYLATGAGAGTISFDLGDIAFSNLTPVDDTVPATNFTFNAPAGDAAIDVFNGPVVGTFQTTQIDSPISAFELINFANKANVTINSGTADQTILLDNPTTPVGLATLTINTNAGPDQVTITAAPAGVATTIFTFAEDDSVSVTGAGIASGTTMILNGGIGFDTLQYDGGNAVVSVTPGGGGQMTITRAGSGSVVLQSFEKVQIFSTIAAPPVPRQPVTFFATQDKNRVDAVVATFTSGGTGSHATDFGATIAWGDGTTSAGVIVQDASDPTVFYVQGSHIYTESGEFTTTTTLRTFGGTTTTNIGNVSVTIAASPSAPVSVNGTAIVQGIEFSSVSNPVVTAGTPLVGPVATFTTIDPGDTAEEFTAEFAPGDGTSATGIVIPGITPGVFTVVAQHTFAVPGSYFGTLTIRSVGGSVLNVPIETQVFGLAATFPTVSATEEVPLNNDVVASIGSDGGPPIDPRFYASTIDWGDATAPTPSFFDPTSGDVRGSHIYLESGSYTVRIVVGTSDIPGLAVFTRTIVVADVPIVLTGQLDPASDSGVSDSDRITFVRQPTFFGTSEGLSRVTLSAQNVSGDPAFSIGGTTADLNGFWQITSRVALIDGQYVVTATAVDKNGVTTATTTLGTITIDTVGPRVTNLGFVQAPGQLIVQFQDDRSGLAQAPLTDGRNYRVRKPHLRPGRLLVGDLSVTPPTDPTGPQTVTAPLTNNGRTNLRSGTFTVTVFDSDLGITDVAGNPLDGEFFGRFPSGNDVPGGDFVAIVDTLHTRILATRPSQQGTPIRNNPGAIPGAVLPLTRAEIASAARKKRQEALKARPDFAKAAAQDRATAQQEAATQARRSPVRIAAKHDSNKPTAQDLTREVAVRSMIRRANWL